MDKSLVPTLQYCVLTKHSSFVMACVVTSSVDGSFSTAACVNAKFRHHILTPNSMLEMLLKCRLMDSFSSNTDKRARAIYDTRSMSQLLAEALQEVQRAEAWALQLVPPLNSTRPAQPLLLGKMLWVPPRPNASAHLHRTRRRGPASSRRLLSAPASLDIRADIHEAAESHEVEPLQLAGVPQQLAGVPQLSVGMLRTPSCGNHTKPCSAAQHRCFESTLAWAVPSTALLSCLLTLLCVWVVARRLRQQPKPVVLTFHNNVATLAPASDKLST